MSASYDEELLARLSQADPAAGVVVDPVTSPQARQLLERTMQTLDQTSPSTAPSPAPRRLGGVVRRPALLAAAAGLVLVLGIGAALSDRPDAPAPRPGTTLALQVAGGLSMSSCLPFDVAVLAQMPVALAGTVTEVEAGQVTLQVDRWYRGGDAMRVTVSQPDAASSVALDGVSFEQGKRFLLTATEGTVNGCGFSGPYSDELAASYEQAFAR